MLSPRSAWLCNRTSKRCLSTGCSLPGHALNQQYHAGGSLQHSCSANTHYALRREHKAQPPLRAGLAPVPDSLRACRHHPPALAPARSRSRIKTLSQSAHGHQELRRQHTAKPGHQTYLLINCSRPCLRSSMKDSSKMPSSPRKGSCRFKAFPGSGGTTI